MEAGIGASSVGSIKVASEAPLPMLTLRSDYTLSPEPHLDLLLSHQAARIIGRHESGEIPTP